MSTNNKNEIVDNIIERDSTRFNPFEASYETDAIIRHGNDFKKYDIKTAEKLIASDNGQDPAMDGYEFIALYRKQNSEYFLYEICHFYDSFDQTLTFKTIFTPFKSELDAKSYCIERLSTSDFQQAFGPVNE